MNIQELKKLSQEELTKLVESGVIGSPYKITIPLDTALASKIYNLSGNIFYVLDASDSSVSVDIAFSRYDAPFFSFTKGLGMVLPFSKFFISSTAQVGKTVTLFIGSFAPEIMQIIDNRSTLAISSDIASLLSLLSGTSAPLTAGAAVALSAEGVLLASNSSRRRATIYNRIGNGLLYVRKAATTTVTTSNYDFALSSGQWEDIEKYTGEIRGLMATSGQSAQVSEV